MTSALRPVRVEQLEGRQLFAGTVDATAPGTGLIDVFSAELRLSKDGSSTAASAGELALVAPGGPRLSLNRGEIEFDEPPGCGLGAVETLTLHNAGIKALTVPAGGLSIEGKHAALFLILSPPSLPTTLLPGESLGVSVVFNPGSSEVVGWKTASLRIAGVGPAAIERFVRLSGFAGTVRHDSSLRCILSVDALSDPHAGPEAFVLP